MDCAPRTHKTLPQCWSNVGPPSTTFYMHLNDRPDRKETSSANFLHLPCLLTHVTQHIYITFVQCWSSIEDVGPVLCNCYRNVLCLPGTCAQYTSSQSYYLPGLTKIHFYFLTYNSYCRLQDASLLKIRVFSGSLDIFAVMKL